METQQNKIAVAMSGGVDSSTVAAILQKDHEILGITMDLFDGCEESIESAYRVCKQLGIEHHVVDFRNAFKKHVMDVFAEFYSNGLTPNPCAICNRDIKLNLLLESAKSLGASRLATGHYAICEDGKLIEARDTFKDQSYFLSLVSRENLNSIDFPLGMIENKESTRQIARSLGIESHNKKDSQDICFIKATYKDFLKECYPEISSMFDEGQIILSKTNKVIGKHNGFANYTIGQRKGLGIAYNEPLYVTGIDSSSKTVYVGTSIQLNRNEFIVKDVNWLIVMPDEFETFVKLRSFAKKVKAHVKRICDNSVAITLLEQSNVPVTPGQICAAYMNDGTIVFGGIISKI